MQVLLLSGEAKGEVGLAQTPNCQRRVVEVSCVESKGPILNLITINSFLPDGPPLRSGWLLLGHHRIISFASSRPFALFAHAERPAVF